MTDNVVKLNIVPKAASSALDEPLPIAASVTVNGEKLDLVQLVTLGVTADGSHYFNSSDMSLADTIMLLESTKHYLLERRDEL